MKKIRAGVEEVYKKKKFRIIAFFLFFIFFFAPQLAGFGKVSYERVKEAVVVEKKPKEKPIPPLNKEEYDRRMLLVANNPPYVPKAVPEGQTPPPPPVYPWPAKDNPYPRDSRAILPFKRIIAYYGNLYSKKMGVLGEYPEVEMLAKLDSEVKKWEAADPETPVQKALHYIAVVAQGSAGADGKYRARMPFAEIDKVLAMAERANAIVFLDIQVGFSTVPIEVPLLEKYLVLPNVHLGLDPEFSMKGEHRPGKAVGTMNAADVNFAINYLSRLVKENNLPPKILIVHRYTRGMLTGYNEITPTPEVQVVIHMDGWGGKARKIGTYKNFIYPEPIQFTGFKLFYKNDLWEKGSTLFEPTELLKLSPKPVYIQYQ